MNPKSASALAWTAAICLVVGLMALSPTGAFALLVLAALCAAIPSLFAAKRPRVIALGLLIAAVVSAAFYYPAFERERANYARQTKDHPTKP